jgi:hypothetical protein
MSMSMTEVRVATGPDHLMMVGLGQDAEILLKARLPRSPAHHRAAITLFEGLALWSGRKLPVAVGVAASSGPWIDDLLPGGSSWTSPLVAIHLVDQDRRRPRPRRLDGLGDFRAALQLRLPVTP